MQGDDLRASNVAVTLADESKARLDRLRGELAPQVSRLLAGE